ncbi:MAG: RDD family protein, partial [Opitutaceae bacterium]|nr:RDD family protein [Opitutaceae bacterium]
RLLATALDTVIIGIVAGLTHSSGLFLLWFAVYHVVIWALRGTTIGGIVCGLKVVRLDDRPVDWTVALVRCLGAFLSFFVIGLGFVWVAFDKERQSWHDKIAGTVIVRMPKGVSLL